MTEGDSPRSASQHQFDEQRRTPENPDGREGPNGLGAVQQIVDLLVDLRQRALELLSLRLERTRVGLRESAWRLVFLAWGLLVVLSASIVAVLRIMSGVAGGLTVLFGGRAWAGDLTGGLLLLLGLWTLGASLHARRRRRAVRILAAKYPLEPESPRSPGGGRPAHDTRRVPGSPGGTSAAGAAPLA